MNKIILNGINYDGHVVIRKVLLPNEMVFDDAIDYVMTHNDDIKLYRSFSEGKDE